MVLFLCRNVEKIDMTHFYYNIYKMKSLISCDYDVTTITVVTKGHIFLFMPAKAGRV